MNRDEFLESLKKRLVSLSDGECEKAISFYSEMLDDRIEDGMSEREAVASFGNMDIIVKTIMSDVPISSIIKVRVNESKKKLNNNALWTVLLIWGFPLWFPLCIVFIALMFAVYILIWSGYLVVCSAMVAICACGICSFITGVMLLFQNTAPGLFSVGASLFFCGMFIMLIKPVILLAKLLVKLTVFIAQKIKSMFIRKKEAA